MTNNQEFMAKVKLVKILTVIRNICATLGCIVLIPLIGEYVGTRFGWFFALHTTLLIFFTVAVIAIEWFVKKIIIQNEKIKFNTIFDFYNEGLFI